jgi:hypothetical protein
MLSRKAVWGNWREHRYLHDLTALYDDESGWKIQELSKRRHEISRRD